MDEYIGVPRDRAAEIIGVPVPRLNRWSANGLVVPSITGRVGARTNASYSLDALVQGRVVCEIEDRGIHVRRIRIFVEHLRTDEHPRPLASLEWGTDDGDVFAKYPTGNWVGGRKPNQFVLVGVIDLEEIRVAARKAATQRVGQPGKTERRRATLGSKEVFAGTRIPVSSVQAYLARGFDTTAILAEYPDLESADVEEARRRLVSSCDSSSITLYRRRVAKCSWAITTRCGRWARPVGHWRATMIRRCTRWTRAPSW